MVTIFWRSVEEKFDIFFDCLIISGSTRIKLSMILISDIIEVRESGFKSTVITVLFIFFKNSVLSPSSKGTKITSDDNIPKDHPRAHSLKIRSKMSDSFQSGILSQNGLIAHGRGEAFDYILGENTNKISLHTIRVATAQLLLSDSVISVNGNSAALCSKEIVKLAKLTNSKIEINLFHKSPTRVKKISQLLKKHGAVDIYGENKKYLTHIPVSYTHLTLPTSDLV